MIGATRSRHKLVTGLWTFALPWLAWDRGQD